MWTRCVYLIGRFTDAACILIWKQFFVARRYYGDHVIFAGVMIIRRHARGCGSRILSRSGPGGAYPRNPGRRGVNYFALARRAASSGSLERRDKMARPFAQEPQLSTTSTSPTCKVPDPE